MCGTLVCKKNYANTICSHAPTKQEEGSRQVFFSDFTDNEAFKEENLDLDLVQISNHPFALLSGRIEIQYPNC